MGRREGIIDAIWIRPGNQSPSPYRATLLYKADGFHQPALSDIGGGIYKVSHRAMSESKVPQREIPAILAEPAEVLASRVL